MTYTHIKKNPNISDHNFQRRIQQPHKKTLPAQSDKYAHNVFVFPLLGRRTLVICLFRCHTSAQCTLLAYQTIVPCMLRNVFFIKPMFTKPSRVDIQKTSLTQKLQNGMVSI